MSHIVEIKTEIRDRVAVDRACRRLRLAAAAEGAARLFQREEQGLLVKLPGWNYPIVCDLASGQVKYDNFGGRWGDPKELDRFVQTCAVEKVHLEARRHGRTVQEQVLQDGSIQLTIQESPL